MRKLVSLGLLALVLLTFSGHLLAGGVGACEEMKEELQELDAYGLCVAWHNANEQAKAKIADKFFERARLPVPGSENPETSQDFYCPCWDEVTFCDIEALGAPRVTIDGESAAVIAVTFLDMVAFTAEGYGTDGESCVHSVQDFQGNYLFYDDNEGNLLVGEEGLDCQAELEAIATMNLEGECP